MKTGFKHAFVGMFVMILLAGCGAPAPEATALPATATSVPATETQIPATETVAPTPEATETPALMTRNIPYISEQLNDQTLDVYLPEGVSGNTPVILAVHGGGGDKADFWRFSSTVSEQGYTTVSINYRQPPRHVYPAPVKDVYCALAWIYANADAYHFDTSRIAAVGHSLGGTFAAGVGTMADRTAFMDNCPNELPDGNVVRGVITFTGVFDYNASTGDLLDYYTGFFQSTPEEAPELWADASPINWIDAGDPPFLLIHGEADGNIEPAHSVNFAAALDAAGVENQLLIIPGGSHFSIINNEEAFQAVDDFLQMIFE